MSFASPQFLILLAALPFIWYVGWPRRVYRRGRDVTSIVLRSSIIILLTLAIAGLQVVRVVDRQAVIFLVDRSDSVGNELREQEVAFIEAAVAEKSPDDEWAVIVFGAEVSIDQPLRTVSEVDPIRSSVPGNQTNLTSAIQTAISLFPSDVRRRIVILSDGRETVGNAAARAQLAQATGVEISYVPLRRELQSDVRIVDLNAPARVGEGQIFDLTVTVEATEPVSNASLRLFSGGSLVREEPVALEAGINRFAFTQRSGDSGFLSFSAQVVVPEGVDELAQNNALAAFSQVVGPPRVLVVTDDAIDTEFLLPGLEEAGVIVETTSPGNLAVDTTTLSQYKSVFMVDVPAQAVSTTQMERLQTYVRDLGGGFVFVGGPESYGPGGYFQTPIEAMLPVETQIRDQQRLPQLTIAYLVDRSGSMGVSSGGTFTNLQLAQRAINLSIDFLQPTDRAAVGTFDSSGAWVAPFQDVSDRTTLQLLVGSLRPGGGTDIMAGMQLVERDIVREPSDLKHLILITDGGANSTGLVEMAERLNEQNNVTLSVIAIGVQQPPFLRQMAEAGQGNYHAIVDVSQIPNILAQETVLATRSYIEEGAFSLVRTARNPMIEGFEALPQIRGYVATTERDTAQVVLRGPAPFSDPVLAWWQYGLGRSIAFTSDATSRWGSEWVQWEQFPRFWAQVVDYSITESAENNIETQLLSDGIDTRIIVNARDDDGVFLNNLPLVASVVSPDNTVERVPLSQTAPGRYEAVFRPETEGAYFVAVNDQGNAAITDIAGTVVGYSPEYARVDPNERLLAELAELTGGRSLAGDPQAAFAITQEPRTAAAPIWPGLLLAAMILLPFDIAVRRLLITRSDLQRFAAWASRMPTDDPAPRDARMSSLFTARDRARQRTDYEESERPTPEAAPNSTVDRLRQRRQQSTTSRPAYTPPETPAPEPKRSSRGPILPPEEKGGGDTVSSLLKRRRRTDDES